MGDSNDTIFYDEDVVNLNTPLTYNYYHFLTEGLARFDYVYGYEKSSHLE